MVTTHGSVGKKRWFVLNSLRTVLRIKEVLFCYIGRFRSHLEPHVASSLSLLHTYDLSSMHDVLERCLLIAPASENSLLKKPHPASARLFR